MAVGENFEELTKETTFHGIRNVFDGKTKVIRRLVLIQIIQ